MTFPRCFLFLCARRLVLCLALFGTLQAAIHASIPINPLRQYHERAWEVEEGLPLGDVESVAQSKNGYLWVGTRRGLARFDGVDFKVIDPPNIPKLKNSFISALCVTRDGSLWIGTSAFGLMQLKDGKFVSHTLGSAPETSNIMTIFESQDGSLWVGTVGGAFHLQNGQWTEYTRRDGLGSSVVRSFCESEGNLWIGTAESLDLRKKEGITTYAPAENRPVRVLFKDQQGTVWMGFIGGLGCLRDGKFTLYTREDGLPDNTISAIFQDHHGDLWVGTYGGLCRFAGGKFVVEKDQRNTFYDRVNAICEDHEGNIWVGTRDALHELRVKHFTTFTRQEGLAHNNIMSVLEDRKGNIWMGTWGGALNRLNESGVSTYSYEGSSIDLVLGIFEDRDGSLFFGTDYTSGAFRMKNGVIDRLWGKKEGAQNPAVRLIWRDREENLWFGTDNGLLLWNGRQRFLETNIIRCMLEDNQGTLWVGTSKGLFFRKNGQFISWSSQEKGLLDTILALYQDAEGSLWIGTAGSGLKRLKDGKLTSYTMRQGLFSDQVFEILEDNHGWLWMSCYKGIFRVSKKNLDELDLKKTPRISSIAYGKADGMENVQCTGIAKPGAWKSRDGRLWFATAKGVVMTDPNIDQESNEQPPPILIEEVVVDKQHFAFPLGDNASAQDLAPTLRVPPGHGDVEFHYTGLSFQAPEKVRFKYKLEGVDSDWTRVTRRVAYYNNLPPGSYLFRVKCCNNDGVWSERDAAVILVLAPHIWQTWWFMTGTAILAVGVAGGTVRYTTKRNIEQELRRLEKQRAIEEERMRIARDMHDEIGAKLTKISFLGAMAKRKLALPQEAGTEVDKMSQTARDVIRALDEIVWAVNPANDTLEHFATYLCRNATEFFENSPVLCQFNIPSELPPLWLGTDLRHNLLLAAKEAMNNVLKHSGATNVVVGIFVEADKFQVVIADNGRGFARDGARPKPVAPRTERVGNGLTNMEQRLVCIGGRCEVHSQSGQGTRIVFTIFLKGEG